MNFQNNEFQNRFQSFEPEPSQVADVPRQQYRYKNPNPKPKPIRKEREPENFGQNSRVDQVRQPVIWIYFFKLFNLLFSI